MTMEQCHVRSYRWAETDRRPLGRSHRSVRIHEPGKSVAHGAGRECLSDLRGGRDLLECDQSFDRRSSCESGWSRRRHQIRDEPTRKFASAAGSTPSNAARRTGKPVQRGTCTLPDGQTLRFLVNDENGASTPDGTFRVFAGMRSDPFILAWLIERRGHEEISKSALQRQRALHRRRVRYGARARSRQGLAVRRDRRNVADSACRAPLSDIHRHGSIGSAVPNRPMFVSTIRD